jgi:CopG antitoxin of type II toxin-antitoxin system
MSKKKAVKPIPEEFAGYEQAARFWDRRDTTDYPEAFRTIKVVSRLRRRHFEIPIAPDVVESLRVRARKRGVTVGRLTNDLLRRELSSAR